MIDEKILVWKFNNGSKEAFTMLYEKYKDDLLGLAITLLRDRSLAEDVVKVSTYGDGWCKAMNRLRSG